MRKLPVLRLIGSTMALTVMVAPASAQSSDALWDLLADGLAEDTGSPAPSSTPETASAGSGEGDIWDMLEGAQTQDLSSEASDSEGSDPDDADAAAVADAHAAFPDSVSAQERFPLRVTAFGYATFATAPQNDRRFSRRRAGIAEYGSALRIHYDEWVADQLRVRAEVIGELDRSRSTRNGRRDQVGIGESFVHFAPTDSLWFRGGNLTVPFGTSDAFPILDVFTPRHDRLWGIDHPFGEHLPIPAGQIVWTHGNFRLQTVVSAAFRGNRVAGAFLDHDYHVRDRIGTNLHERNRPDSFRPEWVTSLNYFGSGLDLGLTFGEVYAKSPTLRGIGIGSQGLMLDTHHPRIGFIGASAAKTMGDWLLRGDAGYFRGETFFNQDFYTDPFNAPGEHVSDVARGVIGLEYSGFSNTVLSLEYSHEAIQNWKPGMRMDRTSNSIAVNARFQLLSETLALEFTAASLANHAASVLRAKAEYSVSDTQTLTLQWTNYNSHKRDGFMAPYERSDRVYMEWRASF
ncbi:MAG: hypothetical protein JJU21_07175 [Salinarimonas sp.]|nr:hypothetical protein [Salinarimonas sp.]